jgi:hypothetical protein
MKWLLFIGNCALIFSCQEHCNDAVQSFELATKDSRICTLQNIDNNAAEVNLVIRSQADQDKYLSCSSGLVIDFSKKMLVAGRYTASHCAQIETQSVDKICTGQLIYNVDIRGDDCTAFTQVFYMVIVDRSDKHVRFNVTYHKP